MFEHKIKKISKDIFQSTETVKYFVLTRKKHQREIYFREENENSLKFLKIKFNSPLKNIFYLLLKIKILHLFLKKTILSKALGDIVFVGNQIKSFDLKKNLVYSFFHTGNKKDFIEGKKTQKKLGEKGFAPKIMKICEIEGYSQEELCKFYEGPESLLFKRLLEFYYIKKVDSLSLLEKIKKDLQEKGLYSGDLKKAIKKINLPYFLGSEIHGDFCKEQCLLKNKKIVFVDWNLKKGIITEDLSNYFNRKVTYWNTKIFQEAIKLFPEHVKKNLISYLLITELLRITRYPHSKEISKNRLTHLLKI